MLSLTLRIGEDIVIGDPKNPLGSFRLIEISGEKARISFDFPRVIEINRKKIADRKAQNP